MDNDRYLELRLEALLAALDTDYHDDVSNLLNSANLIFDFLLGRIAPAS